MASGVVTMDSSINAGGPASSSVTTNTRVSSQTGTLRLQTDVPQFSGPATVGAWTSASSRVMVQQIPVILESSAGTAVIPGSPPTTTSISVTSGDSRVKGT